MKVVRRASHCEGVCRVAMKRLTASDFITGCRGAQWAAPPGLRPEGPAVAHDVFSLCERSPSIAILWWVGCSAAMKNEPRREEHRPNVAPVDSQPLRVGPVESAEIASDMSLRGKRPGRLGQTS